MSRRERAELANCVTKKRCKISFSTVLHRRVAPRKPRWRNEPRSPTRMWLPVCSPIGARASRRPQHSPRCNRLISGWGALPPLQPERAHSRCRSTSGKDGFRGAQRRNKPRERPTCIEPNPLSLGSRAFTYSRLAIDPVNRVNKYLGRCSRLQRPGVVPPAGSRIVIQAARGSRAGVVPRDALGRSG